MINKVVAFYTNDFYEAKARELAMSLGKHWTGPYEITKLQGPKTWNEAVQAKPRFILDSLVSSSCEGILYTDADSCLLCKAPEEILTGDICYVPFKRDPHNPEEVLTGTLYFKNTMAVKAFVLEWIDATEKYKGLDTPEQLSLKEVLEHTTLNVQKLPPEWCFIFDDMREMYPDAKAIFEHYQASREYKTLETKGEVPCLQRERVVDSYASDPSEWTRSKGRGK